jgi:uncharacterized protein (TIGR00730 family)
MQDTNNKEVLNLPGKYLPIKPLTKSELHKIARERVSLIAKEFAEGFRFLENYPKSVTFFGSTRVLEDNEFYIKARSISARITKELGYSILSGGGPGIMEAANRGAFENGGTSVGLTIELPNNQATNPYINNSIDFYYFFSRKVCLSFSAEAYVFFPGGLGTFDEIFEILTLIQTHKIEHVPVIMVGSSYWNDVDALIKKQMLTRGMIDEEDTKLYTITDDEDEILEIIRNAPIRYTEKFDGESILQKYGVGEAKEAHLGKTSLSSKKCIPCEDKVPPMTHPQSEEMLSQINQWIMIDDKKIEKTLSFKNFTEATAFVNKVAHIAEEENHHPDIEIFNFNKVKITLYTHNIDGLSENDFILASKIDEILR